MPEEHSYDWPYNIYGMRYIDNFSSDMLLLLDFNQNAVRDTLRQDEQTSTSKWRVQNQTTVLTSGTYAEPISTSLPYRFAWLPVPPIREEIEEIRVMLSEDHTIIIPAEVSGLLFRGSYEADTFR